jgi:hypothetical protein
VTAHLSLRLDQPITLADLLEVARRAQAMGATPDTEVRVSATSIEVPVRMSVHPQEQHRAPEKVAPAARPRGRRARG